MVKIAVACASFSESPKAKISSGTTIIPPPPPKKPLKNPTKSPPTLPIIIFFASSLLSIILLCENAIKVCIFINFLLFKTVQLSFKLLNFVIFKIYFKIILYNVVYCLQFWENFYIILLLCLKTFCMQKCKIKAILKKGELWYLTNWN